MMKVVALDQWILESRWRRFAGVIVALWVGGIIITAIVQAVADEMELYRWSMLGLLLIGVPLAVITLAYAIRLIGRRLSVIIAVIAALSVVVIALYAYNRAHRFSATRVDSSAMGAYIVAAEAQAAADAAMAVASNPQQSLDPSSDRFTWDEVERDRKAAAETAQTARVEP